MTNDKFEYDVFLSYSSKDKQTVQALGKRLRKDGLRVWMDGRKIARGVEKSRTLVMCMSPDYFESEWGKLQHHSILFRDPTNARRRFLPLLIKDCQHPTSSLNSRTRERRADEKQSIGRRVTRHQNDVGRSFTVFYAFHGFTPARKGTPCP